MDKTDWALLVLNLFAGTGVMIAAGEGGDAAVVAMMMALPALLLNSVVLVRRSRTPERPAREPNELDARTILDLDARLEALERAQADASDAAKWRALVESGQVRGPAPEAPADAAAAYRQPLPNGQ